MSARPAGHVVAATGARGAVEQRMAGIHLRLGSLLLARAELEQLAAEGRLDVMGLADLAEARWRTGELAGASAAAAAHLAAGGVEPIARVIAAEAAAGAGRPGEARAHVAALDALSPAELDLQFAGMPRRAFWPAAPGGAVEELEAFGTARAVGDRPAALPAGAAPRAEAAPGADQGPGLWPEEAAVGPTAASPQRRRAASGATGSPAAATDLGGLLVRARADVRTGDPDRIVAGLDALAVALRLDPTLASGVLEAVGSRREPGALVLRGDACRILGRVLEAEAAYLAAADTLDAQPRQGPS